MPQLALSDGLFTTTRVDAEMRQLADRHYSRQTPGHREFIGPGRTLVLRDASGLVVFVWTFMRHRFDHQWGYNCAIFRNESGRRSSEIILEAEQILFAAWSRQRLFTYVDPAEVKSANPGYCFKMAGWRFVKKTLKGKHLLEKRPW